MDYINKIELQGWVGCVRTNQVQGMTVQNFSLLTEYMNKLKDDSYVCESTWHQVVAWDKAQVEKGDTVKVVGRLRQQKYTAADGTERVYYEVIASELKIIER